MQAVSHYTISEINFIYKIYNITLRAPIKKNPTTLLVGTARGKLPSMSSHQSMPVPCPAKWIQGSSITECSEWLQACCNFDEIPIYYYSTEFECSCHIFYKLFFGPSAFLYGNFWSDQYFFKV